MTVILHTKTDHHYIIDDVEELEVRSGSLEGSPLEDNDGSGLRRQKMRSDLRDEEKNTIVNALRVIKQNCLSYRKICDMDGCTICPLRADEYGNCAIINHTPDNWNINESNEWVAIL